MKTCTRCNQSKPPDQFSYHPHTTDQRRHICLSCERANHRPGKRDAGNERSGYIYLIQASNGLCKIGITQNLDRRIRNFETQSPIPISLLASSHQPAANKLEAQLHRRFAKQHSHGEWFNLSPGQIEYVKERICHATRPPVTDSTNSRSSNLPNYPTI